jgi:hypothetical protein
MSMVKRVLAELKMAVRSDMSAANITAIMIPLEQVKGSVSQDCEERDGRVEDGSQVGHECGQHHGNHDTPGTCKRVSLTRW